MRHQLSFVAILIPALLAGCMTTKPAAPEASRGVAPSLKPDEADALPAGLGPKFQAFLTSQGLANTAAKSGEAARLTAAWNNKVVYAPDPTHGGEPVPGFLAKVWVFGPDESIPLVLEGELLIGMWDNSSKPAGGQPKLLELWHIDPDTAKKFRKRDFMGGEAYTLFLPCSKYHVDLKQVNVVVRFNGADGRNLTTSHETLAIDHSATLQRAAEKIGIQNNDPFKIEGLKVPQLQMQSKGLQP